MSSGIDTARRDRLINDAVKAGKFSPGRVPFWRRLYDADPRGTEATLAQLQPGVLPVGSPRGHSGTPAFGNGDAYRREWFPEAKVQAGPVQPYEPGTIIQERDR